jgi:hypothetical protein
MVRMNTARVTKLENPGPEKEAPDLDSTAAAQAIGRALGAHYSDLVDAPLPDKLLQLLARLDDEQKAKEGGDALG